MYLIGRASGTCITGTKSNAKISDLLEIANNASSDEIQSKKKVARTDFEVLRVALFMKLSGEQEFDKINKNAVKCVFKPGSNISNCQQRNDNLANGTFCRLPSRQIIISPIDKASSRSIK